MGSPAVDDLASLKASGDTLLRLKVPIEQLEEHLELRLELG